MTRGKHSARAANTRARAENTLIRDLEREVKELRAELATRLTVEESADLRSVAAGHLAALAEEKAATAAAQDRADKADAGAQGLARDLEVLADHVQRCLTPCPDCGHCPECSGTTFEAMAVMGGLGRLTGTADRRSVRRVSRSLGSDPDQARARAQAKYTNLVRREKAGP